MSIKQIKSLVQFTRASSLVWQAMTIPIPDGVVTFSIDDGAFKIGDGISLYNALPTLFTYENLLAAQGGVSTLFKTILPADDGKLAIVYLDELLGKVKYAPSTTSLTDILTAISTLEASDASQTTVIATLLSLALSIDIGINTAPDGSIVVINNGRFSNSGTTVAALSAQVIAGAPYIPGSRLEDPVLYMNQSKQLKANKNALLDGNTYYIEVIGYNNDVITLVYNVECANTNVVITNVAGPLFSVRFNNVTGAGKMDTPVILVVSVDDGTGNRLVKKAVTCNIQYNRIITAIYGGIGQDLYYGVAVDSKGNIFCAGNTTSVGQGGATYGDALVTKFDSNLNVLACRSYGSAVDDLFWKVVVDSKDNVICAGQSVEPLKYAIIVKFNNDLNIIAAKWYGTSTYNDVFTNVVITPNDEIIAVGYSGSEGGNNSNSIIYKFDSNLNLLVRKRYGNVGSGVFNDVALDSQGNIYCVGNTYLGSATDHDATIVKYSSDLVLLSHKLYGGAGEDGFNNVTVDSNDNIICVGWTHSEGTGREALIVKFNATLEILARKRYGGSTVDLFSSVIVDLQGNIVCVGQSAPTVGNSEKGFIVKFDSNLNVLACKTYDGSLRDTFTQLVADAQGNLICCGWTTSVGSGSFEGLIIKLPSTLVSGTLTGVTIPLTLADSSFTLADSNLTLSNSTYTSVNTSLDGGDLLPYRTLAGINLNLTKEIIN